MKTKYFIAASACALMATTSVQAADIVNPHAEPVHTDAVALATFGWDGFYAGVEAGGSWGRVKDTKKDDATFQLEKAGKAKKPDGFIGGLYAGYNFRVGDILVLGVDTDLNWSNAHARFADPNPDDGASTEIGFKHKWSGAARARIGLASDRLLPYVAAGVAYSQSDTTYKHTVTAAANANPGAIQNALAASEELKFSKNRKGWTAGFGLDYAMTDNILLRAEYRYTDLGKETFAVTKPDDATHSLRYATNEVRFGVAYKF